MHKSLPLLALAAVAAAQSLAGLPSCATSCVANGLPQNCNLDPKCICQSSSFIDAISCCVSKSCDKNDQDATLTYAKNICNPAGVSDLPSSATCASTASGSSSTGSSSATGSAAGSASSSASGAASSASESASSAASSASDAASSVASSASAAATSASAAAPSSGALSFAGVVGAGLLGVAALL